MRRTSAPTATTLVPGAVVPGVIAEEIRYQEHETKAPTARYSRMPKAIRRWLVLGAACGLLSALVSCSQAPQAGKTTPSPGSAPSTTPSAPAGTVTCGESVVGRGWH